MPNMDIIVQLRDFTRVDGNGNDITEAQNVLWILMMTNVSNITNIMVGNGCQCFNGTY